MTRNQKERSQWNGSGPIEVSGLDEMAEVEECEDEEKELVVNWEVGME